MLCGALRYSVDPAACEISYILRLANQLRRHTIVTFPKGRPRFPLLLILTHWAIPLFNLIARSVDDPFNNSHSQLLLRSKGRAPQLEFRLFIMDYMLDCTQNESGNISR